MVESITILGGRDRSGNPEPVDRLHLQMGEVVSIVGPTGSGKTTLINDIELFADLDTPTRRRVLIDGALPPADYRESPARHPIALITQHTKFLSDLAVEEFLSIHARIRNAEEAEALVARTLRFANELTGEPVDPGVRMTELSGGQTRALLIADAVVICSTPIILLDEIENAGINRARALELLRRHRKVFIFVTHDPHIALLSDFRVVMKTGGMTKVLRTSHEERVLSAKVSQWDEMYCQLREKLRRGLSLAANELEALA